EDRVRVPLLGEEALAVLREILIDSVARDERVERGRHIGRLRAQQPPETLRLPLARAERPRDLDRYRGIGQIDREVRDLRDDENALLAGAERLEEALALVDRGLPRDERSAERLRHRF